MGGLEIGISCITVYPICNRRPETHTHTILSAMQGHSESPRSWEKHTNAILCNVGLIQTVHKPCLYLGIITSQHVIFKQQVDDFAIVAPGERTANILFNMIDDLLQIPLKCQGYLDMYNSIDVKQTKIYIRISCKSFIEKICNKYLNSWMQNFTSTDNHPTPLPIGPTWYTTNLISIVVGLKTLG
jgi:hypothetical protein